MSYSTEQLLDLGMNLIKEAEQRQAPLRLLGGLAFYLNSPKARELSQFKREYKDLDFAITSKGSRHIAETFKNQRWTEDQQFNALHGATRMLFYYGDNLDLQVDLFVGVFEQCHRLNFDKRLELSSQTIPLSDLLLTKLEIHQLNRKDILDIVMLLYDHDFGLVDSNEKADLDYIIDITRNDWGWYTTVNDNLTVIESMLQEFVTADEAQRIQNTIQWIRNAMAEAPKSIKWKMRNRVGRKVQWYELPEEVNR
jgi:hypothetical protein